MVMEKTKVNFLGTYAEGWATGDAQKILGAAAPGFVFTDPNGSVARDAFAGYHAKFVEQYGSAMALSGVVAYEVGDRLVACCVWEAGSLKGTGLIVVGAEGVEREDVVLLYSV